MNTPEINKSPEACGSLPVGHGSALSPAALAEQWEQSAKSDKRRAESLRKRAPRRRASSILYLEATARAYEECAGGLRYSLGVNSSSAPFACVECGHEKGDKIPGHSSVECAQCGHPNDTSEPITFPASADAEVDSAIDAAIAEIMPELRAALKRQLRQRLEVF